MLRNVARVLGRFSAAIALAGLFAFLLAAPATYAARSICRTDPIVKLSNGHVITLWTEIYADLEDVQSVDYHLHVPRGVKVVEVIHPDPETAHLENFYFHDDQLLLVYKARMQANVAGDPVKVRAHMDVQVRGTIIATSQWRTGESNRELRLTALLP